MTRQPVPTGQLPPRLQRELKTIQAMVKMYCHGQHGQAAGDLCRECAELMAYATGRLSHCPFQAHKPTCGKCKIHCYKKEMRARIQAVMRYAGPKMIRHHPFLALRHLVDGLRNTPSPFSSSRLPKGDSKE